MTKETTMRQTIAATMLFVLSSCAPEADALEVEGIEQEVVQPAVPDRVMVFPPPVNPTQNGGVVGTAFPPIQWSGTSVIFYRSNGIDGSGNAEYLVSPGQGLHYVTYQAPGCVREGSHAFRCAGRLIACAMGNFMRDPAYWEFGTSGAWRSWSPDGSDTWSRQSNWGTVANVSSVEQLGSQSRITCYQNLAGKVYKLRRK